MDRRPGLLEAPVVRAHPCHEALDLLDDLRWSVGPVDETVFVVSVERELPERRDVPWKAVQSQGLRKQEKLGRLLLLESSHRGLHPWERMASKSGDVPPRSGRGSAGYDDQKFRSRSHAVQRFALAIWGAVPKSLEMFFSMAESFMTTFSRTTATDAFPLRCASAAADRVWKTQMMADRKSRTPFELGLALENPWQGDPPAKSTCLTSLWRSKVVKSRRHPSSVRAKTEPISPDSSLSLEKWSHSDSFAFASKTALAGGSVSSMIVLMPEAGPGGVPSELKACQQPPIPEKRSKMRILADGTFPLPDGGRASGGALGLVVSA